MSIVQSVRDRIQPVTGGKAGDRPGRFDQLALTRSFLVESLDKVNHEGLVREWFIDGLDWFIDGLDWFINGLDWFIDGLDWFIDGLDWFIDGLDWFIDGLGW